MEEHPEGLFKNTLIQMIEKEGIASRMTIYKHLEEYTVKKINNVMEFREIGKRRICFPSTFTILAGEMMGRMRNVYELLDLIDKNPNLGSYVVTFKYYEKNSVNLKRKKIIEIVDTKEFLDHSQKFLKKGQVSISQPFYQDKIIKEISFFLVDYINQKYKKHSEKLRDELVKQISEITKKCFKIHSKAVQSNEFSKLWEVFKKSQNMERLSFEYNFYPIRTFEKEEFKKNIFSYQELVRLRFQKVGNDNAERTVLNFIECFF